MHPPVPAGLAEQMTVYATHSLWEPSHWLLTLSQLAAVGALALLFVRLEGGASPLRVGILLAMVGLLLGTLGTLSAATALVEAARADESLFRALGAWTMGIGWLCLVVASVGGAIAGACLARASATPTMRALGWAALVGDTAFTLAALVLGPFHPWTHPYLLRFGAVGFGLMLVAAGLAWPRATPSSEESH